MKRSTERGFMIYHEQWCAVHLMCPCDCGGIRVGEIVGPKGEQQGDYVGPARGGNGAPGETGGSRGTGVVGQVDDGHSAGAVESRGPGAGELQGAGSVGHVRRPVDLTDQDLFFAAVHIFAAKAPWPVDSTGAIIESVSLARRIADEVGRRGSVLK